MRRGTFSNADSDAKLDALMARLQHAIDNGESAEAAALQAQIDDLRTETADAKATGVNARQMVLSRDTRLNSLEDVAERFAAVTAAAEATHEQLHADIAAIQLTPGPKGADGANGADGKPGKDGANGQPGRDGADGKPGVDGRDGSDGRAGNDGTNGFNGKDGAPGRDGYNGTTGADGLSAYQVARQNGYGGTQTQWLASLKGNPGTDGATGPAGTPADMTRVTALEMQKVQIEYRDGIAVPAMLSLLGSAATTDVTVTWPTPFPDTNYLPTVQATPLDATLIGRTAAVVKSKTAAGIVVTVTTTAVLAAGKCVLSAIGYRKG